MCWNKRPPHSSRVLFKTCQLPCFRETRYNENLTALRRIVLIHSVFQWNNLRAHHTTKTAFHNQELSSPQSWRTRCAFDCRSWQLKQSFGDTHVRQTEPRGIITWKFFHKRKEHATESGFKAGCYGLDVHAPPRPPVHVLQPHFNSI